MLWHIEVKFCIWLCFNILQIKFECRHSVSILNKFLKELCLFFNLEYRQCVHIHVVFCKILLHVSTYWPEILLMTFFLWTSKQVRVSSICVIFCRSFAPFWNLNIENTVFRTYVLYALTYWAETFFFIFYFLFMRFRSSDCHYLRSSLKGLCPLCMYSFAHVSCACLQIELKSLIWLCFLFTNHSIYKVL